MMSTRPMPRQISPLSTERCKRADAAAAGHRLDETFFHEYRKVELSVRWAYVHMIEEYARHNGHADFLRERLDGATGTERQRSGCSGTPARVRHEGHTVACSTPAKRRIQEHEDDRGAADRFVVRGADGMQAAESAMPPGPRVGLGAPDDQSLQRLNRHGRKVGDSAQRASCPKIRFDVTGHYAAAGSLASQLRTARARGVREAHVEFALHEDENGRSSAQRGVVGLDGMNLTGRDDAARVAARFCAADRQSLHDVPTRQIRRKP